MSEFQVGQKVQALKSHASTTSHQGITYILVDAGDTGEIVDKEYLEEDDSVCNYGVSFIGVTDTIWYSGSDLRAVVTTQEVLARIADTLDKMLDQGKPADVAQTLYVSGEITSDMWKRSNGPEPEPEPVKGEVKRKLKDLKVGDKFIESGSISDDSRFGGLMLDTQKVYSIKYLQNNIIELFRGDDTRFWIGNAEDEVRVYVG